MAGVEVDLEQGRGRQLEKEIMQLVVDDDGVGIPLAAFCGRVVGAKGLVPLISLIPISGNSCIEVTNFANLSSFINLGLFGLGFILDMLTD